MSKILLIDDEQPLRDEVSDWLQFEGHEVLTAANGRLGLALIIQEQPDLIICDIAMPEMDGRTVLLEVRANPMVNHIPFIFLTASATYESIRRGMDLGADDYLTKPFRHGDLLKAIESRLHKQAEQQARAQRQLEAVNKAFQEEQERRLLKSRIVAMFSHDFRNPLFAITSAVDLIENYGERLDAARKHSYLQRISGSARLLLQMLDDMLLAAELENGHLDYHPQPIELVPLVETILDEFRMIYAHSHQFSFETTFAGVLTSDPKLLRAIATNLLSNAVKYSPTGTPIMVRLTGDPAAIVLQIIDQGVGIPAADRQHLFEPFYRAAHEQGIKGTGLGLTIVHQAVTLCGGTIEVQSEVGQGSTFVVKLPHQPHTPEQP